MKYIIGIDEVGRGPLAGPVVVCAAAVEKGIGFKVRGLGKPKDSKKLTESQREAWFSYFSNNPKIRFTIARVSPKIIDKINISRAANLAAKRCMQKLMAKSYWLMARSEVFLDGGLYLGNKRDERGKKGMKGVKSTTVIKGDDKILAVSIASIIAKVTRDRLMARMAKKYPQYGFEVHKGYGTLRHRRAINKHGPSSIHRLTFLRSIV